ncbi:DUF1624 domain-containing protein [Pontibacter liquoris]|uniref:DUF1624 domain-containing protein n=1 Tax=Pontibacter liquoris TaxID=2905677 RepID=UPI001FA79C93|nr:heparan-alpha-glucosaminide N-acetyltransferase domain-containing protein [Pontibacter liquoris]
MVTTSDESGTLAAIFGKTHATIVRASIKRVHSIDVIRGIVMIIMVLDHVRDMLHLTSITQSPTDLATTTPALFFTRWVTHLCAPVFVFLSGTSAFISVSNKQDLAASRSFLLTRGFWLIVVEFTLVNFGLWFDIHFNVFLFDVIATIGCGFVVLGLLLGKSTRTIATIGLVIIFCHNLTAFIPGEATSLFKTLVMPFFAPAAIPFGDGKTFVMGYPPIPWLGIMLVGFTAGNLFLKEIAEKKRLFLRIGLASIALFLIIRSYNIYGDTVPWSVQKNGLYTFLSFINLTKYPPSLDFCLLFLGIMFLLLAALEGVQNRFTAIAAVYGKVPLFYFVIHWYIIHPIVFAMVFLQGYKASDMVFGFNFGRPKEGSSGLGLIPIYLIWIAVVVLLYPLCKWYGSYKEKHRDVKWLRYL